MLVIKYFMLFLILVACTLIGRFLSKKYIYRLNELEEMKNALNVFEAKIKFTYEPIPQIFQEMSENIDKNISNIFVNAKNKMQDKNASIAWEEAWAAFRSLATRFSTTRRGWTSRPSRCRALLKPHYTTTSYLNVRRQKSF